MKIGIITFHFAHNQGAVLQCYALQTALSNLGHTPNVIDYRPAYHAAKYAARKNPFALASNNRKKYKNSNLFKREYQAFRGFCRGLMTYINPKDSLREKNFESFFNRHLLLTKRYSSLKKLQKNAPRFDAYVSGSDQLWNPELLDGDFDPAYFLCFGEKDVHRFTYAISLKQTYSTEHTAKLEALCKNIPVISAREHNDTLDAITSGNYTVCIDPTLLLEKEAFAPLESEIGETEPYIFVYGFENSDDIQKAVKTVADQTGYHVINGSPDKIKLDGNVKNVRNYAPDQFLTYIKNAAYVVTNSFHGTAFSIIYQKQFLTVPHTTRGKRMVELLHKIGLSDRLWGDATARFDAPIDYDSAHDALLKLREQSLAYLKSNLKL